MTFAAAWGLNIKNQFSEEAWRYILCSRNGTDQSMTPQGQLNQYDARDLIITLQRHQRHPFKVIETDRTKGAGTDLFRVVLLSF